jgi:hypothetical protein
MTHPEPRTTTYVVGNTYRKLNPPNGGLNRRKRQRFDEHEWTVYVDIVEGNPDHFHSVSFLLDESVQGRNIVCKTPIQVDLSNGRKVWRFLSDKKQSSTGVAPAIIKLTGRGGTVRKCSYGLAFRQGGKRSNPQTFVETRKLQAKKWVKMPDVDFGIELELSCKHGESQHFISRELLKHAGVPVTHVKGWSAGKKQIDGWKLVHDGSIQCSRHYPDCSKFELVSPILRGGEGLNECNNIVKALNAYTSVSVNKSMGFHVHINVTGLSAQELGKVCQNFVKFEDAIDSFLPPSRRTNQSHFCKSNRAAILPNGPNAARHQALGSCKTIVELCDLMNPADDRYYKLNLTNLKTGRQPTIEFRQHSATCNYDKVAAWIRFCMAFVYNSAKQPRPAAFKPHTSVAAQFDVLFELVIQDRRCRDYFVHRRHEVLGQGARGPCCASCGHDESCSDR